MTAVLVGLWAVPLAAVLYAAARGRRARLSRRQTVDVLALIPELTGGVAPGTATRAADVAAAVAGRLGLDPGVVATAARLYGVAPEVLTESGICPGIATVVRDATNAPRGQAQGEAAVVRVAHTYARRAGETRAPASGVLFTTVVDHAAGDERHAAEALVHLVQGGACSA